MIGFVSLKFHFETAERLHMRHDVLMEGILITCRDLKWEPQSVLDAIKRNLDTGGMTIPTMRRDLRKKAALWRAQTRGR